MTSDIILPPLVAWASGTLARGALILKSTRLADLNGLFADRDALPIYMQVKLAGNFL